MAGQWQRTRTAGIFTQVGATGQKRYRVAFRDKRGVVTSKTFSRFEDAKTFHADIQQKRARRSLPDVSLGRRTMTELWEHFLKISSARPSTRAWYESRWHAWIEPSFGNRRVDSMRRSDIEEFYVEVERAGSVSTRRAVQQLMHKLFEVAVQSEWLSRNPADGISMPTAKGREPRFLTTEEVGAIADQVAPRYKALIWTLAVTGLRIGEASALRVRDVTAKGLRVRENSPEVSGRKLIGPTKTDGSERVVPLPPKLRAMLKDHITTYSNAFDPEAFVFTSPGRSIDGRAVPAQIRQNQFRRRVFQPAAERAGIHPRPTVQDLRHTAAPLMLTNGFSTWETAKVLGHSTTTMVERRYGHIYRDDLQERAELVLESAFGTMV